MTLKIPSAFLTLFSVEAEDSVDHKWQLLASKLGDAYEINLPPRSLMTNGAAISLKGTTASGAIRKFFIADSGSWNGVTKITCQFDIFNEKNPRGAELAVAATDVAVFGDCFDSKLFTSMSWYQRQLKTGLLFGTKVSQEMMCLNRAVESYVMESARNHPTAASLQRAINIIATVVPRDEKIQFLLESRDAILRSLNDRLRKELAPEKLAELEASLVGHGSPSV